jgi:hypothetical protein
MKESRIFSCPLDSRRKDKYVDAPTNRTEAAPKTTMYCDKYCSCRGRKRKKYIVCRTTLHHLLNDIYNTERV